MDEVVAEFVEQRVELALLDSDDVERLYVSTPDGALQPFNPHTFRMRVRVWFMLRGTDFTPKDVDAVLDGVLRRVAEEGAVGASESPGGNSVRLHARG